MELQIEFMGLGAEPSGHDQKWTVISATHLASNVEKGDIVKYMPCIEDAHR